MRRIKLKKITARILFAVLMLAHVLAFAAENPAAGNASESSRDKDTGALNAPGNLGASNDSVKADAFGGGYAVTGRLPGVGYMAVMYDATNGLPTSEANCVLGSTAGYVWIGGYSGIIRHDGKFFERVPVSTGLTNGRGLFEDSKKRVWVATNDNGVVVMTPYDTTHFTKKNGLPSSSVRDFAEDSTGRVYIGTTSGVAYVNSDMTVRLVDDKRINNERILRLVSDVEGNVFGQTKSGAVFALENGAVT